MREKFLEQEFVKVMMQSHLRTELKLIWTIGASACVLSCFSQVQLFATLWTVICLAPLSTGFSRQGYWSGLSRPLPGHLPDPGIELMSPEFHTNIMCEKIFSKCLQMMNRKPPLPQTF